MREQQIAIEALGRPANFDPKIDPIVRVSIASIRERLQTYFEQEGSAEPIRLTLPKGQYRLLFELRAPGPHGHVVEGAEARSRFWTPYLSPGNPNLMVFTEMLFYRDESGNFVRNIYVNDRATGEAEIKKALGLGEEREFTPTYHFVSAGEMNCLLSVTRMFFQLGASLGLHNSRFFSWADLRRANLILIGSSRTNPFVRSLQGSLPLVLTPHSIEDREAPPEKPVSWSGQRYRDGDLERLPEYAVVTRRSGPVAGTTLTMITANHGRAIERAGRFITEESHLLGLEEAFGGAALPPHFQLLLRVEMLDYDEEVVDVSYVTHRVLR